VVIDPPDRDPRTTARPMVDFPTMFRWFKRAPPATDPSPTAGPLPVPEVRSEPETIRHYRLTRKLGVAGAS
jgi:hypothetical protein